MFTTKTEKDEYRWDYDITIKQLFIRRLSDDGIVKIPNVKDWSTAEFELYIGKYADDLTYTV